MQRGLITESLESLLSYYSNATRMEHEMSASRKGGTRSRTVVTAGATITCASDPQAANDPSKTRLRGMIRGVEYGPVNHNAYDDRPAAPTSPGSKWVAARTPAVES